MLEHEQIDQNIRHKNQTIVNEAIGQLEKVKHITLQRIRAAVQIPASFVRKIKAVERKMQQVNLVLK